VTRALGRARRGPRRACPSAVGWLGGAARRQDPDHVNSSAFRNSAMPPRRTRRARAGPSMEGVAVDTRHLIRDVMANNNVKEQYRVYKIVGSPRPRDIHRNCRCPNAIRPSGRRTHAGTPLARSPPDEQVRADDRRAPAVHTVSRTHPADGRPALGCDRDGRRRGRREGSVPAAAASRTRRTHGGCAR